MMEKTSQSQTLMARVAEAWYPRCIGESFFVPSKLLPKLWETGMISPNSVTIKK